MSRRTMNEIRHAAEIRRRTIRRQRQERIDLGLTVRQYERMKLYLRFTDYTPHDEALAIEYVKGGK